MDWSRGWLELVDMIWPRRCGVCGDCLDTDERYVCAECLTDMPLTYFWSWRNNPAEQILWARTYLQGVVSLMYFSKDNDYRRLLYAVKYQGNAPMGRWLGHMLGLHMHGEYPVPDVIVPVPLHWCRKWKRGYNQAEVIARGISEGLGGKVPVLTGILRRVRYSTSQTRMSVGNKWENVTGAFVIGDIKKAADKLSGRHVLLVDDVLTTGATVEACWEALRCIPDVRISYASVAFVPRNV